MTTRDSLEPPFHARGVYRAITGAVGVFLLSLGAYLLVLTATSGFVAIATGLGLMLLGANAVLAGLRGTRAWIARIGPLP